MPRIVAGFALLALVFGFIAGYSAPAAAEFFGCDDQHRARSASYRVPSLVRSPFTHELAAQANRPHHYSSRTSYIVPRREWNERSRW
jgi:hypothetical protein